MPFRAGGATTTGHNQRVPTSSAPSWRPLAVLLAAAGVTHALAPRIYDPLVPRWLGDPRPWVLGSGAAEVACAVGLAVPRTRRAAALATAALFVGVFPGNVQMALTALRSPKASPAYRAVAVARLPLQVPLVRWALRVARTEG
jgi:uncharacterized membrane protein